MNNLEIKNAILKMIYQNRENIRGQIFWHEKIASQFQINHESVSALLKELRHDNHIGYKDGEDHTETFNNEKNPTLTEYGRQFVEHGGYNGRLTLDVQPLPLLETSAAQTIKPNANEINENPIIVILNKYWWAFVVPLAAGIIVLWIEKH